MKRECILFDIEEWLSEFPQFRNSGIKIYIDKEEAHDIVELLEVNKKKTRMILFTIFSGNHNDKLYGREEVSEKAKNVTAMKYSGTEKNIRIYCKEFFEGNKKIVMITFISKKVQKASSKKIKSLLETIGGYDYDF